MSSGPQAHFHAELQNGRFVLQRCEACTQYIFYPRALCPHCGGADLTWREASGRGTVYSRAAVSRPPDKGGSYGIVLVDLAEGPRMMATVADIPAAEIAIDMPVHARIDRNETGQAFVVFVAMQAAGGQA